VIEESELIRRSMVEYVKRKGWVVHGVRRAEQALPILRHIPYQLILIDCDISKTTGTDFARFICELCKREATRLLVIIAGSIFSHRFRTMRRDFGKRSAWKDEVLRVLTDMP
jgi:DNA-binding response OmpR family regulator